MRVLQSPGTGQRLSGIILRPDRLDQVLKPGRWRRAKGPGATSTGESVEFRPCVVGGTPGLVTPTPTPTPTPGIA